MPSSPLLGSTENESERCRVETRASEPPPSTAKTPTWAAPRLKTRAREASAVCLAPVAVTVPGMRCQALVTKPKALSTTRLHCRHIPDSRTATAVAVHLGLMGCDEALRGKRRRPHPLRAGNVEGRPRGIRCPCLSRTKASRGSTKKRSPGHDCNRCSAEKTTRTM